MVQEPAAAESTDGSAPSTPEQPEQREVPGEQLRPDVFEQLVLRRQEVRSMTQTSRWSRITAIATVIAASAATWAAYWAGSAVQIAQDAVERAASEARIGTSLDALGGDQPAQRVGGFTLLRRTAETRMESATDDADRTDAFNLYVLALDVIINYLKDPIDPPTSAPDPTKPPGIPDSRAFAGGAQDRQYAATQLRGLLSTENQKRVADLRQNRPVRVDLSNVDLAGVSLPAVDFSWLNTAYTPGADLRAAELSNSRWGTPTLQAAKLQCANLANAQMTRTSNSEQTRANLQQANLSHANLTGADLTGADLRGANLTGATIEGAKLQLADLTDVTWNGVIGSPADRAEITGAARPFNTSLCVAEGKAG